LLFFKLSLFIFINTLGVLYSYADNAISDWVDLYNGVSYKLLDDSEKGIKVHQIRIDVTHPDVEFFIDAPKKGEDGFYVPSTKPSTFLSKKKAQVVINGTAYSPANLAPEGQPKTPDSLAIFNGIEYAPVGEENAAFLVLNDRSVKIIRNEELPNYQDNIKMALGAWHWAGVQGLLVENGEILVSDHNDDEKAVRTSIGLSEDEKTVYLVVVEGRPRQGSVFQDLVGHGVYLEDLAHIMQSIGCHTAMNLDGGGAATMVIENINNGKPLVLNTPSDHKGERATGSH